LENLEMKYSNELEAKKKDLKAKYAKVIYFPFFL
jgi:hypothetical protein